MHDPDFDPAHRASLTRLRRLRRLARLALVWERTLLACWRSLCWTGFFMALWLLQWPAMLGDTGNALALILFLGGLAFFARRDRQHLSWPDEPSADRRLEQDSGVAHRPLQHLGDALANPDKSETRHLWQHARGRAHGLIRSLRAPRPRPLLARHDPAALRVLVALFLLLGFISAGSQWRDRLAFGLFPFSAHWQDRTGDNIVLWITPPDYTHLPRITIQGTAQADKTVTVPAGSVIKARIRGGIGRPVLAMGNMRLKLQRLDDKNGGGDRSWGVEAVAVPTSAITISQFLQTRISVPVRYAADQPPKITLKGPPKILPRGAMQFDVSVEDDYGVGTLVLKMKADPAAGGMPLGGPAEIERAVMSPPGQPAELKPVYDLSWHPWAGRPVILELEARDGQGHTAAIPPIHMTLPERPFYNPVAQQLVALRKRLAWTPVNAAANVSYDLETLLSRPGDFGGDLVVFLSIRSAASHLIWAPSTATAATVIPQLWDTALRVEDGNLSLTARSLRQAQQDLQKLLDDPNSTPDQLATAMEHLRQAMGDYLGQLYQEMQKRMAKNGQDPAQLTPDMFSRKLDLDQLSAFLEKMQAQALSGSRDSARQMLSQLQQMTDQMDPATNTQIPPQLEAMLKSIAGMDKLIAGQKDLLDRTQKEAGPPPAYPQPIPYNKEQIDKWNAGPMPPAPQTPAARQQNTQAERDTQEGLRHDLGQIMADAGTAMDKIPDSMQKAEQLMRGASTQLGLNRPDIAVPFQQNTLEQLQQSSDDMKKQLQAMLQQMTMLSFGMGPLDPLGRPMSEGNGSPLLPDSSVKVPDEAQRKQVQEILKLLRQRSGELSRPDYELDYYRRLMKQF